MKKFLLLLTCCLVGGVSFGSAASLHTMENYISRYCDDIYPARYCGVYQNDIDTANDKIARLHALLDRYDTATQEDIIDQLVDQFSDVFDSSSTVRIKLLAAYYTLALGQADVSFDTEDMIAFLFNETKTTSYYPTTYTSSRVTTSTSRYTPVSSSQDGQLRGFTPLDTRTTINTSRREISVSGKTMQIRIRATDDDGRSATLNNGYRVIAEINNRSYAATYDSDGDWEFRFGDTLRQGDDISFLLLCKTCTSGRRYSSNTALDGWYIVDEETFEIRGSLGSTTSSSSSSNRNYDLAIRHVAWDYDINSRDIDVRLTTTVRNEGRYDTILENLRYTIEVDNDRLSSRDYDIRHIDVNCDNRSINSSQAYNIRIDEDDECEVVVEITLDRDDTEDQYVDIEVEVEADRDDYRTNDTKSIRFRAN